MKCYDYCNQDLEIFQCAGDLAVVRTIHGMITKNYTAGLRWTKNGVTIEYRATLGDSPNPNPNTNPNGLTLKPNPNPNPNPGVALYSIIVPQKQNISKGSGLQKSSACQVQARYSPPCWAVMAIF